MTPARISVTTAKPTMVASQSSERAKVRIESVADGSADDGLAFDESVMHFIVGAMKHVPA
jgi:hypothetical protein